jgi:hypothetical protein
VRIGALISALALIPSLAVAGGPAATGGAGSHTTHMSFSKRAEIGFPAGAEGIPAMVRPEIARIAARLKADLASAPGAVEVEAYAPDPSARIVALQRAVDVRLALVESGLPAERIDVRVVPRVSSEGTSDMVTIYLRRR